MHKTAVIAVGVVALGGCNQGPSVNEKNASVEEVATKVRAANGNEGFVQPGEWQSHVTIESFDIPGMPPEAVKQMRASIAQNRENSFTSCLTEEDAKQPKGKFFTGNDQCRYDHFTMGNGKIDAAMKCASGQGMTQVMTMKGNYSPTSYDMRMTMKGEGMSGPASGMTMQMRVESKRTGECKPASVASK